MPLYEYHCTRCATTYEVLRPMSRSNEPATCPNGHPGSARTISLVASTPRGESAGTGDAPMAGGCACGGGGCGCGH